MRITYPDVHNLSASANPTRVARKLQADQGLRASWWRSGGACGADGERAGRAARTVSGRGVQVPRLGRPRGSPRYGARPQIWRRAHGRLSDKKSPGPNGPGDYRSGWRDLNPRPLRPERSALPSCATPRCRSSIASPCRYSQTETERALEVWSTPHVVRPRRASESRAACGGDAFLRGVHVQQRRLGARRDANLCVGGGPQAS